MNEAIAVQDENQVGSSNRPSGQLSSDNRRKSLRAVAVGNLLEWFDWTLYGVFSAYLAANFFDQQDSTSALLSTLAVFAGGFVARPIGGFVFGRLGDRVGRKTILLITMTLLALSSLAFAILPTYEQIGPWASALLLITRLVQGLAHGGEAGVSYTYVAEIAPKERRGLWSSAVYVSVNLGVMAATALAAVLAGILADDAMNAWGWRIGFALGAVLALYVFYLRRAAHETDVFESNKESESTESVQPITKRQMLKIALFIIALSAAMNTFYSIWITFAASNAIAVYKMDAFGAYIASLIAQALVLGLLPLFGRLSDRIGRRPTMVMFGVGIILAIMPIQMILSEQPWTLFVAQFVGMAVWAIGVSIYPVLMAELVPTRVRAMGVGVVISLSAAIFAGTSAYLYTWLNSLDLGWVFDAYLVVLALFTIVAAVKMRETKGMDLNDVDADITGKASQARR
ncbi:MFS transporter [Citricoccus sp. NPDC055426]|uniref:MFS transporter n=1 Tax=Citricoccus sp. NPDC055426 TaxID=3155536 RepID=UPI0034286E86